jgi:site-specific DNA-methyltransferase (adenine-specific)
MKVHFSSKSNEWTTPQNFYIKLNDEFNFTLDPCCTKESAKCKKYYTIEDDGLSQDWSNERVFMNPPYGREIGKWIKKAYEESKKSAIVVCLIPARTDTRYWWDFIFPYAEVRFIKGRLKFTNNGKSAPAPFPSAIVIFGGKK